MEVNYARKVIVDFGGVEKVEIAASATFTDEDFGDTGDYAPELLLQQAREVVRRVLSLDIAELRRIAPSYSVVHRITVTGAPPA
ncbi:hypothetical protein FDA94_29095 [Herbidospora galbida]|uniref:Uncharacterized protein n=1 Tax=Herbidospora galbida TaxID=2575442 RepID=A0A4U3M8M4_9ACTN|nr:hypothetical protein [Herbidospora galbida]TKK84672.1 hypothetical protein FDA94_29095 [Herbidospora galbida]